MANPTLHLTVDKGPKQGETLARSAGTQIRIGRVVKGNNFPIKDPGISQKHITIEFVAEISRWTVKDLDTSNGTFINDAIIPSFTPFPLSDGDTIKIGETTLISVKIEGGDEVDVDVDVGLRRGRRRPARPRAESSVSVAEVDDNEEVERNAVVRVEETKNMGGGRPKRGNSSRALKKDEILDAAVEQNVEVRPRRTGTRTRSASARISKDEGANENNAVAGPVAVMEENELVDSVVEDSIEPPKDVKRGRPKRAPPRARARAPSAKANELRQGDSLAEEVGEKGELNVAEGSTVSSSAKALQAGELLQSDLLAEEVGKKGELNDESNVADKIKEGGSGEGEKGKTVEEEAVADFEKMTLGEWFDNMDKCLPLAINEVAEQMIASLKEKARLFDEYVMNVPNDG